MSAGQPGPRIGGQRAGLGSGAAKAQGHCRRACCTLKRCCVLAAPCAATGAAPSFNLVTRRTRSRRWRSWMGPRCLLPACCPLLPCCRCRCECTVLHWPACTPLGCAWAPLHAPPASPGCGCLPPQVGGRALRLAWARQRAPRGPSLEWGHGQATAQSSSAELSPTVGSGSPSHPMGMLPVMAASPAGGAPVAAPGNVVWRTEVFLAVLVCCPQRGLPATLLPNRTCARLLALCLQATPAQ